MIVSTPATLKTRLARSVRHNASVSAMAVIASPGVWGQAPPAPQSFSNRGDCFVANDTPRKDRRWTGASCPRGRDWELAMTPGLLFSEQNKGQTLAQLTKNLAFQEVLIGKGSRGGFAPVCALASLQEKPQTSSIKPTPAWSIKSRLTAYQPRCSDIVARAASHCISWSVLATPSGEPSHRKSRYRRWGASRTRGPPHCSRKSSFGSRQLWAPQALDRR